MAGLLSGGAAPPPPGPPAIGLMGAPPPGPPPGMMFGYGRPPMRMPMPGMMPPRGMPMYPPRAPLQPRAPYRPPPRVQAPQQDPMRLEDDEEDKKAKRDLPNPYEHMAKPVPAAPIVSKKATISAAPVMRDKDKEKHRLMPTSLKVRRETVKAKPKWDLRCGCALLTFVAGRACIRTRKRLLLLHTRLLARVQLRTRPTTSSCRR